jgi:O-antigen ligase
METVTTKNAPPYPFRLVGAVALCLMAFTGVFARGLANGAYALLLAWAVADIVLRRMAGLPSLSKIPRCYWTGVGIYLGIYLLASVLSGAPTKSFMKLGLLAYLLAILPSVWLALDELPEIMPPLLPLFYAAGLVVVGIMTFFEAGCSLNCMRAKASLGVIELAAVLGQLTPLMVGAFALSRLNPRRLAFYAVSLVAAGVALALNCSRIALICAPLLGLVVFIAFRRDLGMKLSLALVAIALLGGIMALSDSKIIGRFSAMSEVSGENAANEERFLRWRQGLDVFIEHPVLGAGPGAIPNPPPEQFPEGLRHRKRSNAEFYHAHHVFLTVLAEAGILGMAGFLALHLFPLVYVLPSVKSKNPWTRFWAWGAITVFLQLILNGLVDNVFTLKPLMYVYWTATGLAVYLTCQERSGSASRPPAS